MIIKVIIGILLPIHIFAQTTMSHRYDRQNRIIETAFDCKIIKYEYDADGNRTRRQVVATPNRPTILIADTCSLASNLRVVTYKWKQTRNNIVRDIPENSQFISAKRYGSGFYELTIGDANGCTATSDLTSVSGCATATEELLDGSPIFIYPNPTTDLLTIETPNQTLPLSINVMNTIGQTVLATKNHTSKTIFNLSNLSNGIYTVKISNGREVVVRKVVLQK